MKRSVSVYPLPRKNSDNKQNKTILLLFFTKIKTLLSFFFYYKYKLYIKNKIDLIILSLIEIKKIQFS
jgi:hypothetical protein